MRGTNHHLVITTRTITHDEDPAIPAGKSRTEPLFAFPIQLVKATDKDESAFDLAAPSGAPYEVRYVDKGTGEDFAYADLQRGVRDGDDFHPVSDEALRAIDENLKTDVISVVGSCNLGDLPADRIQGVYFLQSPPKGGSAKAYRLLYEALRPARKRGTRPAQRAQALITKHTAKTRQRLGAIYADEKRGCLMMLHLSFAGVTREPDATILKPQQAEVAAAQVEQARRLVGSLGNGLDALATEMDDTVAARSELMRQALNGTTVQAPTPPAATTAAADLQQQLLASLASIA